MKRFPGRRRPQMGHTRLCLGIPSVEHEPRAGTGEATGGRPVSFPRGPPFPLGHPQALGHGQCWGNKKPLPLPTGPARRTPSARPPRVRARRLWCGCGRHPRPGSRPPPPPEPLSSTRALEPWGASPAHLPPGPKASVGEDRGAGGGGPRLSFSAARQALAPAGPGGPAGRPPRL